MDFDWSAQVTLGRRLLDAACSLEFLARHEQVPLVGPAEMCKIFLVPGLGCAAVRAGHTVRFTAADRCFREMTHLRVDYSGDKSFLAPDL